MSPSFKKSLFSKAIIFIIIANFILTSSPVGYCSRAFAADNLSASHAKKGNPKAKAIIEDLKEATDGGDLSQRIIVGLKEIDKGNVAVAGGKGANLGELLRIKGISVPPGWAVTTKAFQLHIDRGMLEIENHQKITLRQYIEHRLKDLDYENSEKVAEAGQDIRIAIQLAEMPEEVTEEIIKWYGELCREAEVPDLPVAVRSSATAEDMAEASFAGQQDTYLNMRGIEEVLDAVKRDWASLFTDRAIYYRKKMGIDHSKAYLSAITQRMIESKVAGTAFSVEVSTGFPTFKIDVSYGLGEGVVSGRANPDSFIVKKDKAGRFRILRRDFGTKLQKVVYRKERGLKAREGTEVVDTSYEERHTFCLTDEQVLELAKAIEIIHNHYGRYMDIEWAFDANGKLWILQARPETVWNKWEESNPDTVKIENKIVPDEVAQKAKVLLSGVIGSRSASGKVVIVDATKEGIELAKELSRVKPGDILVTTMTRPDMVPAMKRSGAIVTNEGGPTCHAAIVARELELPCVVGTAKATKILKEGMIITVDANRGKIYEGVLEIVLLVDNVYIPGLPKTKTQIGVIVASPFLAMRMWQFSKYLSHYGVSLLRKEFADTTEILVHPLAGLAYDKYFDPNFKDEATRIRIKENIINNEQLRTDIETIIKGYPNYKEFYKDKLANTIAVIAAAQTGGQRVKFRTTDFKTNEYKEQIGGPLFESQENNPMMGYRGIYRMLSQDYKEAFELEIEAIKKARELQTNIDVMFPVVRTVEELEEAVELMAKHGLFIGKDRCQIGMMVEVPSNVFMAEEFYAKLAELAKKYKTKAFMSIGSNDMTQFILGLGRDNDKMKPFFDEANPAVKRALEIVIKTTKKYGIVSGLCGQRPSNDPKFAAFLVGCGIDSIGVVPEVYKNVVRVVAEQERQLAGKPFDPTIAGYEVPAQMGNPKTLVATNVDASEIIKEIGIHPLVLLSYAKGEVKDTNLKKKLDETLKGKAKDFVKQKVYNALVAKAKSVSAETPIVYSTDDMVKTDYEALLGGKELEPFDENPQLGFNGLARVVDPEYKEFLRWQLEAIKKFMNDNKDRNIFIKLDLARTLLEVNTALEIIKSAGLVPGQDGFKVGMEISVPADLLLINEFIQAGIAFLSENNDRFLSYTLSEDPNSKYIQIAPERKARVLEKVRRIWTYAAEKNNVPLVEFEGGKGLIDRGPTILPLDIKRFEEKPPITPIPALAGSPLLTNGGNAEDEAIIIRDLKAAFKIDDTKSIEPLMAKLLELQELSLNLGKGEPLSSEDAIDIIRGMAEGQRKGETLYIRSSFKELFPSDNAIGAINIGDYEARLYADEKGAITIVLYPTAQGLKKRFASEEERADGGAALKEISVSEEKVYTAFANEEWNGFVDSLRLAKAAQMVLVISADTILKNAGTISALRQIKASLASLEIVVWTTKEKEAQTLKLMGVEEIASIQLKDLQGILAELQNKGIANERIVLINSEEELDIKGLLKDKQGITALNLKAPKAKEESSINAMPFVVARAVTQVLKDEDVTQQYQKLSNVYVKNNLISEEDLKSLNDLTSQISEVPLVKVSEEIAQDQITYEETMGEI